MLSLDPPAPLVGLNLKGETPNLGRRFIHGADLSVVFSLDTSSSLFCLCNNLSVSFLVLVTSSLLLSVSFFRAGLCNKLDFNISVGSFVSFNDSFRFILSSCLVRISANSLFIQPVALPLAKPPSPFVSPPPPLPLLSLLLMFEFEVLSEFITLSTDKEGVLPWYFSSDINFLKFAFA